jgi:hypothetical protein
MWRLGMNTTNGIDMRFTTMALSALTMEKVARYAKVEVAEVLAVVEKREVPQAVVARILDVLHTFSRPV